MQQTRIESAVEITANYASGFLVAYLTYQFIVIPIPWLLGDAFWVTVLFTAVSIVRSYLWRRFFNAGLHRAVHVLLTTKKRKSDE